MAGEWWSTWKTVPWRAIGKADTVRYLGPDGVVETGLVVRYRANPDEPLIKAAIDTGPDATSMRAMSVDPDGLVEIRLIFPEPHADS